MNPIINNIDKQFSSKTSEIFDSLQKNLKILPNSNKEDNENNFSITKLKNLYDECVQAGKLNISEDSQKLIFDNINKVLKSDKLDKENFREFFSGEGIKNIFFSQQSPDENKDNDSIFLSAFKLVGGGENELKYGNLKEKIAKFFHMINNPNDSNSNPTLEEEEKAETQTNEIFKYLGLEDEDNIMSFDKFKSFLSGPSTINDIKDDLI
jgi:hypothetical protein